MSAIDLLLIVEGQTEELFVRRVLAPHMAARGLITKPLLPGRGESRRGGRWPWSSVRSDVLAAFSTKNVRFCGIMFDYYGLPNWPGLNEAQAAAMSQRAAVVEKSLSRDVISAAGDKINPDRFLPHIQLHEYEAKLYSDCEVLAEALDVRVSALHRAVPEWKTPEGIDNGPTTAPSKRLEGLSRNYAKTSVGVSVAEKIGLASIRAKCPHFAQWLDRIERIPRRLA